jgi:hypothetical protein
MGGRRPTVNELVAMLSHAKLPTVIVEGKDDNRIYRWVAERVRSRKVYVQAVGGKDNLQLIYKRRNEFAHLPVAFIADKDMLLFSKIPLEYSEIIWTQGYSIENDLYAGAELESLLNADDTAKHQQVLYSIIEWFAFEVEEHLEGRVAKVATSCDIIVPPGQTMMDERFRKSRGFRPPNEELHQQIKDAYQLKLRGKSLLEILLRFLSSPYHGEYDEVTLHEIAVKMTPHHPLMNRLIREVERKIAQHALRN